jgi:predicted nucleic acid-binding protein
MTAIIDSGAMVQLLLRTDTTPTATLRVRDEHDLHAPHVIDPEVLGAFRKLVLRGELPLTRAHELLSLYETVPIARYSHTPYLSGVWALRDEISPYDALYVTLAAELRLLLITADRRLARAAMRHCTVQLLD